VKVLYEEKEIQLPDVMMIGAAKSGTTTLYQYMVQHPAIYFPKERKEPFYFSFGGEKPKYTDPSFAKNLVWKTSDYLALYDRAQVNQVLVDGSTSYLYTSEKTIQTIQKMYGDQAKKVKIMVILRHPAERAFSHYTYLIRNGHEDVSFEQAIDPTTIANRKNIRWGYDYLEYGLYAKQIKPFLDFFENVEVFLFEDLKKPEEVSRRLFSFLEIENIPITLDFIANPSGIPKSKGFIRLIRGNVFTRLLRKILPSSIKNQLKIQRDDLMRKSMVKKPLDLEMRKKLIAYYQKDIEQLQVLLKRDLSHWLN
jgi:hypothetical protein